MSNLYIDEYTSAGMVQGSPIPALKGFVDNQKVSLSGIHAETTRDFHSNTNIMRLKNEGSVTCYYKVGTAAALASSPATTSDRAILAYGIEDIYVETDIKGGSVRLSAVTA